MNIVMSDRQKSEIRKQKSEVRRDKSAEVGRQQLNSQCGAHGI
jgi:(p)ppGpp synthase/HD superfamily hydrolase